MDEFDFFKDIDTKEVSKNTLISEIDIIYLKNEEFDKLSKSKGLGFIKIIEREYGVDLSVKREKFLEYLKEHKKDGAKELFISPPKSNSQKYSKILAVILLFLILLGVVYIIYVNIHQFSNKDNIVLNNQIVKETKKIAEIDINDTNISLDDMTKEDGNDSQNTVLDSDNNDSNISKTIVENSEDNATQEETRNDTDKNITTKDANKTSIEKKFYTDNVVIDPKSKIWIGVVNLSNYKKRSFIRDKNLSLDLNGSYIVTTGHGMFKIYYHDKVLNFSTKRSIKFLIKENNVTEISKKEFIRLNKGRSW